MSPSKIEIVDQLSALAGEANVISDAEGMGRFLREPRKRFHKNAQAVVLPADIAALQAIVRGKALPATVVAMPFVPTNYYKP